MPIHATSATWRRSSLSRSVHDTIRASRRPVAILLPPLEKLQTRNRLGHVPRLFRCYNPFQMPVTLRFTIQPLINHMPRLTG